jgi:CDP-diacylglycerol--serine O-phosphatidyltransferase
MLNNSLSVFAPGMMNTNGLLASIVLIFPVIMPICGALRLAKFNIDTTQTKSFKGLPIPANALAVISVVIASHYSHSQLIDSFTASPLLLILFTIILSLLMVTRIPLFSLKISNFKLKGNEGRYILAVLIVIFFVIFGILALPLIVPLYLVSSALSLLF